MKLEKGVYLLLFNFFFIVNNIKLVKPFSDFALLLSGGYSYNAFYPIILYPLIKSIDIALTYISVRIFSARMLIVLEKK